MLRRLSLLLGVFGCAPATPTASTPAPLAATATRPASDEPPAAPPNQACAALADAQSKVFRAATAVADEDERVTEQELSVLPDQLARCLDAGDGHWALRVSELAAVRDEHFSGFSGTLEYVFLDSKGIVTTLAEPTMQSGGFQNLSVTTLRAEDTNGDGRKELFVCLDLDHLEPGPGFMRSSSVRACRVLAARGDAVAEAVGDDIWIERVEDVDRDGRLDLLTHSPFRALARLEDGYCSLANCSQDPARGPLWLLHSRGDGHFAPDDAVAHQHAKRACPAAPRSLLSNTGLAQKDFVELVNGLACAEAWRVDPTRLRTELARARSALCRDPRDCEEFDALDRLVGVSRSRLPHVR